MTLQQMAALKRWHLANREQSPLEYHAWDGVLTLWVLGWMGWPPALLLSWGWLLPLLALCFVAPRLYVRMRRRLHERGALRCDWLPALA